MKCLKTIRLGSAPCSSYLLIFQMYWDTVHLLPSCIARAYRPTGHSDDHWFLVLQGSRGLQHKYDTLNFNA